DSEIVYLKEKLSLKDDEFYLTNSLSGENLDTLINVLKDRYRGN
ncbi:unnamed protein product, partial [marine sediment metagenome]